MYYSILFYYFLVSRLFLFFYPYLDSLVFFLTVVLSLISQYSVFLSNNTFIFYNSSVLFCTNTFYISFLDWLHL